MLRHCPIPRFSSAGARRKMPNVACGKEKTFPVPVESQALDLADPKDIATEAFPPQKVLKIFSINIIAQGLPFCRRRVSFVLTNLGLAVQPQILKMSGVKRLPLFSIVVALHNNLFFKTESN